MGSAHSHGRRISVVLARPSVLLPGLLGVACLSIDWLAGGGVGWLGRTGLVALGLSAATAVWRWVGGTDDARYQPIEDLQGQTEREHLGYLGQLRRRLWRDRDPRSGKCLRRLRHTYGRLSTARCAARSTGADGPGRRSPAGEAAVFLVPQIARTIAGALAGRAQMATDQMRTKLLESRSDLLDEVQQSIARLEVTLDSLQAAIVDTDRDDRHAQLRAELDEELAVAQRVQQRMDELDREIAAVVQGASR